MMKRLIVCGGLEFNDKDLLFQKVGEIVDRYGEVELVSGHARGADTLAEVFAHEKGIPIKVFAAEWNKYGRAAGPIRNSQMLRYALQAEPLLIALWNGKSRGTKNMIMQAQKENVDCVIVIFDEAEKIDGQ